MNAIDRPGTFRGRVTDHGVSETRNGFPQWVATIQALEFYDASGEMTENHEPGYVAWGDFEQDMTAYLVLYTVDQKSETGWKECLNAKQIKKVFGSLGIPPLRSLLRRCRRRRQLAYSRRKILEAAACNGSKGRHLGPCSIDSQQCDSI